MTRLLDGLDRQTTSLEQLVSGDADLPRASQQLSELFSAARDADRGKKVFTEVTCGDCHKLEDAGQHVGPDLRTLIDKSPQALLVATIDPNRALEDRFVDYTAVTADGLTINGMLLEETSNSGTAGRPFLMQVGAQKLSGKVLSTGTWDRYSRQKFGRVELEPGEHRLVFRSDGPISGPLIDLRSVELVPAGPTRAP